MTTQQCLLGDHAAPLARHACHRCTDHVRRQLREIEQYEQYRALSAMLLPARRGTSGGSRAPGFGSAPPANLDVIVAGDKRSTRLPLESRDHDPVTDDDDPGYFVLGVIESEARSARESLGDPAPSGRATLTTEIGYLLGAVERIALTEWVDEFAASIRSIHADLRRLVGDAPPKPLAPCLEVGCDGAVFWRTDAHLPAEQRSDKATCSSCARTYEGMGLLRLSAQLAS